MRLLLSVAMSAEESLHQPEPDPTDGEMYEVGADEVGDEVGDGDGDGNQPSWSSLTVAALKSALVERGLQTTGRKADLVARLEASHSGVLSLSSLHDVVCVFPLFMWYCFYGVSMFTLGVSISQMLCLRAAARSLLLATCLASLAAVQYGT